MKRSKLVYTGDGFHFANDVPVTAIHDATSAGAAPGPTRQAPDDGFSLPPRRQRPRCRYDADTPWTFSM
jgi:hypothetical protein